MSTRHDASHYENHQRAAELHDVTHAHRVAEQHGKEVHLTGHESTRKELEHSPDAHQNTQAATVGHGIAAFNHEDIAAIAHEKAGDAWKGHRRRIGSMPWNICGPALSVARR